MSSKNMSAFIFYIFLVSTAYAQQWSPWMSIQGNTRSAVQYSYCLTPVSSGNSFAMKVKNISMETVCGNFDVVLSMTTGKKTVSGSFKDLKPDGKERKCYGVLQFADVLSVVNVGATSLNDCGVQALQQAAAPAVFVVDYHNDVNKQGKFRFVDPKGQYSFESVASSGHWKAANDPLSQQANQSPDGEMKKGRPLDGYGMIPSGTWYVTGIRDKTTVRLTLTPGVDVVNPKQRNGFQIHGFNTTPEDASTGCIILDKASREKLMNVFLRDGKVTLKVQTKVY